MTRISALFAATAMAILPLSAFAQTAATAPAKPAAAAVSDLKTPMQPKTSEPHSHRAKAGVPAKVAEPAKS